MLAIVLSLGSVSFGKCLFKKRQGRGSHKALRMPLKDIFVMGSEAQGSSGSGLVLSWALRLSAKASALPSSNKEVMKEVKVGNKNS